MVFSPTLIGLRPLGKSIFQKILNRTATILPRRCQFLPDLIIKKRLTMTNLATVAIRQQIVQAILAGLLIRGRLHFLYHLFHALCKCDSFRIPLSHIVSIACDLLDRSQTQPTQLMCVMTDGTHVSSSPLTFKGTTGRPTHFPFSFLSFHCLHVLFPVSDFTVN